MSNSNKLTLTSPFDNVKNVASVVVSIREGQLQKFHLTKLSQVICLFSKADYPEVYVIFMANSPSTSYSSMFAVFVRLKIDIPATFGYVNMVSCPSIRLLAVPSSIWSEYGAPKSRLILKQRVP